MHLTLIRIVRNLLYTAIAETQLPIYCTVPGVVSKVPTRVRVRVRVRGKVKVEVHLATWGRIEGTN